MPEILTPQQQIEKVIKITDFSKYSSFIQENFAEEPDCIYLKGDFPRLVVTSPGGRTEEFYQWWAFLGMLQHQVSFPSLRGVWDRHFSVKGWKRSPFEAEHSVANAQYCGSANIQNIEIKEKLIKHLAEMGKPIADQEAIYGMFLGIGAGKVSYPSDKEISKLIAQIPDRLSMTRPIALPDKSLNERFAAIKLPSFTNERYYTGEEAEVIKREQFLEIIYPQVARIIRPYFDPRKALIDNKR